MGFSYVRQSAANIQDGLEITAAPLNAEFNALRDAFDATAGHSHDATVGESQKISLTTSISGILPIANGGFAGIHNLVAVTNPGVGDDTGDGYVVGSIWINVTLDRVYIAVDVTLGAAVWAFVGTGAGSWQPLDATLTSLAAYNTNGILTQTAADTFAGRTIIAPAAGITITDGSGVSGNPTLVLANDLAALEALASTGIAVHTGVSTWVERTITGTANEITVTNGSGVSGNPTLSLPASVVITTLSATTLTATGAFTSLGIDDNATAERLEIADTQIIFGPTSGTAIFTLSGGTAAGSLLLKGGISGADEQPSIGLFASGHATLGQDIQFRAGLSGGIVYTWDNSALTHIFTGATTFSSTVSVGTNLLMPSAGVINFASSDVTITHSTNLLTFAGGSYQFDNTVKIGTFSNTGATAGVDIISGAFYDTSKTVTSTAQHMRIYNPNGIIGSIATATSTTSFNTSSDQTKKNDLGAMLLTDAERIIKLLNLHSFTWKADDTHDFGVFAQELQIIYPQAVTEGGWFNRTTGEACDINDANSEYNPWQVDYSKLVTPIARTLQGVLERLDKLEKMN